MPARTLPKYGNRRDELLAIAEEVSAEIGPEGLKLREIARRAGIAAPTIYNHFDSFDSLLAELVGQMLDQLSAAYEGAASLPPIDAVREICRAHVHVFCAHPGAARILLADFSIPGGHGAIDGAKEKLSTLNRLDAELIERGIRSGEFREIDPYEVTLARVGITLIRLTAKWMKDPTLNKKEQNNVSEMIFDYTYRIISSS